MIDPIMLQYLDANDEDARLDWAQQHMEWHTAIFLKATQLGYQRYDTYPQIRDIEDLEGWTYYHALEHVNIARSIQSGEPPDLADLDPSDPENWESWLSVHSDIHAFIRTALGIIG